MVAVSFEKAPAERIEIDEDDPRVLAQLRLDNAGNSSKRCTRVSSTSEEMVSDTAYVTVDSVNSPRGQLFKISAEDPEAAAKRDRKPGSDDGADDAVRHVRERVVIGGGVGVIAVEQWILEEFENEFRRAHERYGKDEREPLGKR